VSQDAGEIVGPLTYTSSVDIYESDNGLAVDENLGRVEIAVHRRLGAWRNRAQPVNNGFDSGSQLRRDCLEQPGMVRSSLMRAGHLTGHVIRFRKEIEQGDEVRPAGNTFRSTRQGGPEGTAGHRL
jgi:hypothetical protein